MGEGEGKRKSWKEKRMSWKRRKRNLNMERKRSCKVEREIKTGKRCNFFFFFSFRAVMN
jgi:hypothetical protein